MCVQSLSVAKSLNIASSNFEYQPFFHLYRSINGSYQVDHCIEHSNKSTVYVSIMYIPALV